MASDRYASSPAETAAGASADAASAADAPNYAEQRRQEIAQQKREARESGAQREAECAAWQAEVDRLEPNRRVFFTNEAGETERMDQVQGTAGVGAQAYDVAGVGRDLRLIQNDMKQGGTDPDG